MAITDDDETTSPRPARQSAVKSAPAKTAVAAAATAASAAAASAKSVVVRSSTPRKSRAAAPSSKPARAKVSRTGQSATADESATIEEPTATDETTAVPETTTAPAATAAPESTAVEASDSIDEMTTVRRSSRAKSPVQEIAEVESPIEAAPHEESAEFDSIVGFTAPVPAPAKKLSWPELSSTEVVLEVDGLVKRFGETTAVDDVSFSLAPGTFTGIVGPNGAGKTTTLSMITGLLRPSEGAVSIGGFDVWTDPVAAKRRVGVLPDRLHLFDRLTGAQLLYYTGVLHGLDRRTAIQRADELAHAFRVEHAMGRLVTDYSSGMVKKVALAAALIHSPRLLVLDEPFESVDPVSAANIEDILRQYTASGGTIIVSSHSMDLVQRMCDHVAVIAQGRLLASGTVDEVRGAQTLQDRFIDLVGGRHHAEGPQWLRQS